MQKLGGLFVSSVVLTGLFTGCGGVERARQDAGRDTGGSDTFVPDTFVPPSDSSIDSIVSNDSALPEAGADTAVQDSGSDANVVQDTAVDMGNGSTQYWVDCDCDTYPRDSNAVLSVGGPPDLPPPACPALPNGCNTRGWTTRAVSVATVDCNDSRADVNKGITTPSAVPISGNNWDYNCNGTNDVAPVTMCSTVCTGLGQSLCQTLQSSGTYCWVTAPTGACGSTAGGTYQERCSWNVASSSCSVNSGSAPGRPCI